MLAETRGEPLVAAVVLFTLWYVVSATVAWWRLRHIPGPVVARFSYLWHIYYLLRGNGGPVYAGLHNRYAGGGPFVRITPNTVVTNDPDILRQIAAARTRYGRDAWYEGAQFHPEYGNVASIIDNEKHDALKAKTASSYSGRENGPDFEPAIDAQIAALAALIRRKHLSTSDRLRVAEISVLMRYFTLDVITRLGYGKPFGHLEEGADVTGYVGYLDVALKYVAVVFEVPLLRSFMFSRFGLSWLGPKPTDKRGPGRILKYVFFVFSRHIFFGCM